MDALVIVIIALATIAVLGLLAASFGADSRDLGDESPVGLTA